MPMWRCPHCGTPQSETSRCWVCKRSSTSCGTCRHFRRSIAGHLGYCGLDSRRVPLRGDEQRGCWEAGATVEIQQPAPIRIARPQEKPSAPAAATSKRLDFVPVGTAGPAARSRRRRPVKPRSVAAALAQDPLLGFWGEEA